MTIVWMNHNYHSICTIAILNLLYLRVVSVYQYYYIMPIKKYSVACIKINDIIASYFLFFVFVLFEQFQKMSSEESSRRWGVFAEETTMHGLKRTRTSDISLARRQVIIFLLVLVWNWSSSIVQYSIVRHGIAQHSTAQHGTVRCSLVQFRYNTCFSIWPFRARTSVTPLLLDPFQL